MDLDDERAQQRLDALRRQVYRSDATAEDRARYAALRDALQPAESAPPEPTPPAAAPRSSRTLLRAGLVVLPLVLALGAALGLQQRPVRPAASPSPGAVVVLDAGTGAVVQGASRSPSWTLYHDGIVSHGTRAVQVDGLPAVAEVIRGSGGAVVRLDVSSAPADGRLVVVLSSGSASEIGWQAIRSTQDPTAITTDEVLARSAATTRTGLPAASIIDYTGGPPTSVAVRTGSGVPWTLTTTFVPDSTDFR